MGALEIILLAAGAIIFIVSFCIPVKQEKLKEETRTLARQEVKSLVLKELEQVRGRLTELSEEEMQQQIDKSERTMERISNEKIMAVHEYSDTVLEEIHKNHEEVVFLYDMLKGKRENLQTSLDQAEQDIQDLLQQVKDSEITVRENLKKVPRKKKAPAKSKASAEAKVETAAKKAAEPGGMEESRMAGEAAAVTGAQGAGQEEGRTAFLPFMPERVEAVPKDRAAMERPDAGTEEMFAEDVTAGNEAVDMEGAEGKSAESMLSMEELSMMFMPSGIEENMAINSNERILEFHRAGKSDMSIARDLGLGIGEVKLVIDLYEGM